MARDGECGAKRQDLGREVFSLVDKIYNKALQRKGLEVGLFFLFNLSLKPS